MLAKDVILAFDGNHDSIPTGFVRETRLDGRFLKGTGEGTNPDVGGGSHTHTHSSSSHTHAMNGHGHFVTTTENQHIDAGVTDSDGNAFFWGEHFHQGTIATLASTSVSSVAVTYGAVSSNPPFYNFIFVRSQRFNFIPDDCVVLRQTSFRQGFTFHSASANRFWRGAGGGSNAGSTGGSLTNTHSIAHNHSTSHGHIGSTGDPSQGFTAGLAGVNEFTAGVHTHSVTLDNESINSGNNTSIGSQSGTIQPSFRTLNPYKNVSGNARVPINGDICVWLEDLNDIPVGFDLCDGTKGTPDMRNRFLKIPTHASASTTGGSNTHTHNSQGHSHNIINHVHTGTVHPTTHEGAKKRHGSRHQAWNRTFSHTISQCNGSTASLATSNTSANSSDNQPVFRTVAFIMYKFGVGGAIMQAIL